MPRPFVICLCFLSLAANSWTNAQNNDEEAIRKGNAYIDEMLRDMFEDNDDFDPYRMDDSVIGFWKKVVFVNISGEAKLHDGTIKGLRTLHRSGDCILEENGEKLKVKADLGAGILNFYYSGSAKFMNFGPTITVEGELAYIEVYLEFTVDAKTGKNGKLTKFTIDDMRGMKVWISGLGPINWAVNPIISGVTKIFKRFVRNFMEKRVRTYIAERISDYQFPVEGGGETEAPSTPATPEDTTQPQDPETPTAQPETPTPEESTPAPETPTPEESTPAPETPTPEESTPAPETPTPEESTPAPETPTPEESTPAPETPTPEELTLVPETPTPEELTPSPETETPLPEELTPAPETETPLPDELTPAPETETPLPEEPDEPEEPEEPEEPLK